MRTSDSKIAKRKINIERKKKSKTVSYLLENGTLEDMKFVKHWTQKQLDFQWRYYSELA
jgi:hypothetical protein